MDETRYGLRVELGVPYEAAVEQTRAALQATGFGVLTTIDVRETLKAKLGRDFRKYMIFGACNPPLASRALDAEIDIGLLLPCNVIIYETTPGRSVVTAIAPLEAMSVVGDNPTLRAVAHDADERLRSALRSLEQAAAVSST